MPNRNQFHDVGMPIYNGMWRYREEWKNSISPIAETAMGDASTVYRFDFCSHTGTYLETSQHKLNNDILLSDFSLQDYVRSCKLVVVEVGEGKEISLQEFKAALKRVGLRIEENDALIVATGWGLNHRDSSYLNRCPFFSEELVDWIAGHKLGLLGVDTPILDNYHAPFGAVPRLFERNPRLLLLAPLVIDPAEVVGGRYFLFAAPLQVEGVSASLCRPLLAVEPAT